MKQTKLAAIHPNAGLEIEFQRKLERLIAEMQASLEYWLSAAYRATPPEGLAQDASPAATILAILKRLMRKWNRKFAESAKPMAEYFALAVKNRTDNALRAALKKTGMTVKFTVTPPIQDILTASVGENVSLIRTIASEHLSDVEQMVMRSVRAGRDLGGLREELQKRYGITKRRAALIARQSNNDATAAVTRSRYLELGITEAQWVHSNAGREPRPEHVHWNGKTYDVATGMWSKVSQKYVWPGTDFNCLPGESIIEFSAGCKKLWRRRYSGNLTEIVTSSGKVINATPNHPILTGRGWLPIKAVDIGDYVIRIPEQIVQSLDTNKQGKKTKIAELFSTVAEFIKPEKTAASRSEFHGDVTDSEVETINIDRFLPDELDSAFCQKFCELFFPGAVQVIGAACDFKIGGSQAATLGRLFGAPESVIGGFGSLLSLLRSHGAHADNICFRLTANLNAAFQQAATDDATGNVIAFRELKLANAGLIIGDNQIVGELLAIFSHAGRLWNLDTPSANMFGKRRRIDADKSGCLFEGFTGRYEFDSVINKSVRSFSGHVYNLENEVNWFSSDTCIIHNCRCSSRAIVKSNNVATRAIAKDAAPSFMESQHPRDADGKFTKVSGGVTHPKEGTTTHKVWSLAHKLSNQFGTYATKKQVLEAAKEEGLNPATVATQYSLWSKFHGLTKSKAPTAPVEPKMTEAEIQDLINPPPAPPIVQKTQKEQNEELAEKSGFVSVSEAVEKIAQNVGLKKEGIFDGIEYYKKDNKKISFKPDTQSWQIKVDDKLFAEGESLEGLMDFASKMKEQHPTPPKPAIAAPTPPPVAPITPAPMSVPINTGNFKTDAKTVAAKNGFSYKIGNETYNYFVNPNGSKISVNHKTGDWKYQTAAGGKASGKGIEKLQYAVEQMVKQESNMPSASAPQFASAPQPKAQVSGSFEFSTYGVPLPHALPQSHKSSLKTYTGGTYSSINYALRTGAKDVGNSVKRHILNMQKAFATVPPLQKEVKVGRKINFDGLQKMCKLAGLSHPDQLQPGHVIVDNGFVSTSHSDVWSGDVKMNITLPPGSKAIYVEPISNHPHEDETILPSGTKFKVSKVEATPYLHADIQGHRNYGKKSYLLYLEVVI